MAKKALINKQAGAGEVQRARVHAVPAVRPAARRVPPVRAVPDLLPRAGPQRRDPRRHEGVMVKARRPTSPIPSRTCSPGSATRTSAYKDDLVVPASKIERGASPRSLRRGVRRRATSPRARASTRGPRPPEVRRSGSGDHRHPAHLASPGRRVYRGATSFRACSAGWASRSCRRPRA